MAPLALLDCNLYHGSFIYSARIIFCVSGPMVWEQKSLRQTVPAHPLDCEVQVFISVLVWVGGHNYLCLGNQGNTPKNKVTVELMVRGDHLEGYWSLCGFRPQIVHILESSNHLIDNNELCYNSCSVRLWVRWLNGSVIILLWKAEKREV